MPQKFDVVVIGTGTIGTTVAYDCKEAGKSVAIIDSREYGGTCALRGCVPKKVYTAIGKAIDWANRLDGKGVERNNLSVNWGELQNFKKSFTDPFPESRRSGYGNAGIATLDGRARFRDEKTIRVGDEDITGEHIVIATGSKPRPLSLPGHEHIITSEEFLNLEELPEHVLFTGGGYISMEFAHVAAMAGADVRVVHRSPLPLKPFDPDLVKLLVESGRTKGIEFNLDTEVTAVEKDGDAFKVKAASKGNEEVFDADLVVHGAGRVPQIDDLDLDAALVDYTSGGVEVNEYLQSSSNPNVYAGGDAAASGAPLTPIATVEGHAISENILNGNHKTVNYSYVASTAFTLPPLSSVGLSEGEAEKQALKYKVNYQETGNWVTSRRIGEDYTGFKIILEEDTEKILGAHILGPNSEEVINIFGLAIKEGLSAKSLREMIYAYPTSASDINYMV